MTATPKKTYRVWTHECPAIEVSASSNKEALALALALVAENPPFEPARDVAAWYCNAGGAVETHTWPKRFFTPLEAPYARVKPKAAFNRY